MALDHGSPTATGTIEVDASPAAVYGLVTDLDVMAELAEETVEMHWVSGSSAAPGAVFRGSNRNGSRRWSTSCRVTDAEPGTLFAFEVTTVARIPVAQWAYRIEALDGGSGCRVTESTWDRRPGWFKRPGGWIVGVSDRTGANAAHIAATLERLKARAETTPASR